MLGRRNVVLFVSCLGYGYKVMVFPFSIFENIGLLFVWFYHKVLFFLVLIFFGGLWKLLLLRLALGIILSILFTWIVVSSHLSWTLILVLRVSWWTAFLFHNSMNRCYFTLLFVFASWFWSWFLSYLNNFNLVFRNLWLNIILSFFLQPKPFLSSSFLRLRSNNLNPHFFLQLHLIRIFRHLRLNLNNRIL